MKTLVHLTVLGLVALLSEPTFAQQPAPAAKDTAQPATASPAELDQQFAKMQEQMSRMQEQMQKISQAKDPQERQRLLQEHWSTMQSAMSTMHGMWSTGGTGCCGTGGRTMGGPMMMWKDYRELTPDQLRQRQYMMDRWMPMQQQMMDQMMQHQQWMMQPQPRATPNK